MNGMKRDFDADDAEFLNEFDKSLKALRATYGPCPHPDLITAAKAGVELDGLPGILQHIDACPSCRQLARDMAECEPADASPEEDRRIRARWENREPARTKRRWWILQPFAAGAAVAALVVVIVLIYTFRPAGPERIAVNTN